MKVLSLDENHPLLNQSLREAGFEVDEDTTSPKREILLKIQEYDGVILRSRLAINKEFMSFGSRLKFIGRVGAGLENIDEKFAEKRNISIFNAPEGNRDSVGEHALGMLLMLLHRLKIGDSEMRKGIWRREENRGDELMGKTVGIMGYGNMGKAFAQRLKGFGVEVICYDIKENVGDENARQVSLEELVEKTDVFSLHTPQTPETLGIINTEFIQSFKKPFYFINTARGKSVITKDLVKALQEKKVKGACLDVHEYEKKSFENLSFEELPEDFQYLLEAENVILEPHIAGWTHQSKEKLARVIVNKIVEWKKFHKLAP
ncbi:MAG: 2-hydroxyacid dehydrogenase [Weeksellaceae bacterium]|jgi:D-3-phosphoglycerate dehydrogenase|nr:2-hydroxyacid dehydrogenase [Weeksellaceae bacterium]MDX9704433.1 2-hydroxyacid dehydrogenase [Weeksellaceae bacterium]